MRILGIDYGDVRIGLAVSDLTGMIAQAVGVISGRDEEKRLLELSDYMTLDDGRRVLAYGGDFEDRASDYGFCTNGIVYADRTPSPKVQEVKDLYSNLKMKLENGILSVENRNLFTDTDAYIFKVTLEKEGEVFGTEEHKIHIKAGESDSVTIGLTTPEIGGEYVYTVSAILENDTIWANKGHEAAFAQEIVRVNAEENPAVPVKGEIVRGDFCIGVHGKDFSMMFDKREGGISSLVYRGEEFITRTPKISFWRPSTDNDNGAGYPFAMAQWQIAGKRAKHLGEKLNCKENADSLELTFVFAAPTIPSFEYKVIYTAYFDGRLGVRAEYPGVSGMLDMPIFGIDFKMKKKYNKFRYYGMGPDENYIDRCCGARLGVFTSTVEENFSKYLNPQECGNRTGVRSVKIYDEKGTGVQFSCMENPFEMSVLPYSTYELDHAMHREELPEPSWTWIRIDAKQMGVGGDDSWGAPVHQEYKIPAESPLTLAFEIRPL